MTWLSHQFFGDVDHEWLCFLISFFLSLSSHSWGLNFAAPDAGKCAAGYVEGARLIAAVRTGGHCVAHCLETRFKSWCGYTAVAQHSKLVNKMSLLLVVVSTEQLQERTCSEIPSGDAKLRVKKKKLRGLSPRANYTDRAAAAGRRS